MHTLCLLCFLEFLEVGVLNRVLFCSPSWPETPYIAQAGPKCVTILFVSAEIAGAIPALFLAFWDRTSFCIPRTIPCFLRNGSQDSCFLGVFFKNRKWTMFLQTLTFMFMYGSKPRLGSNSWFFCFQWINAGVTGLHLHTEYKVFFYIARYCLLKLESEIKTKVLAT